MTSSLYERCLEMTIIVPIPSYSHGIIPIPMESFLFPFPPIRSPKHPTYLFSFHLIPIPTASNTSNYI